MTSNHMKSLREDVGKGIDEDEEPLEAEIPRMNPKNPHESRQNKNMKIRAMLFTEVGVCRRKRSW